MATILTDLSLRLFAQTSELKKGLKESSSSVKRFNSNVKKTSANASKNFKSLSKNASSSFSQLSGGLNSFGPAASQATGGFQQLAAGAKLLNVALGPVGIIIAAIALVVKGLASYFKGSVDGATQFAEIMGFIKGVLNAINDVFIQVGRTIVKAFDDPKKAINDLWEVIKTNLYNRWLGIIDLFKNSFDVIKNGFKGVAQALKGIFSEEAREKSKKYFKASKDGLVEMGKAAIQVATGLDEAGRKNLADKLLAGLKEINEASSENAKIEKQKILLQLDNLKFRERSAKVERQIAELIRISSDKENATNEEREQAIKRASELREQLGNTEVDLAQRALSLQEQQMALSENGIDDLEERVRLVEGVEAAEKKVEDQLREIENRNEEIQNQIRAEAKTAEQAAQKRSKSIIDANNKALDSFRKLQKEKIDLDIELGRKDIFDEKIKAAKLATQELIDNYKLEASKRKSIIDDVVEYEKIARANLAKEELLIERERNEELKSLRISYAEQTAESLGLITESLGNIFISQKNKELKAAGDNAVKREKIERKYAKKEQNISIVQGLINTALAVTKALSGSPPPLNFILAAATAAAGAAQIAAITSQSFAKGGLAFGPTLGLVGEYPGARTNPEVIAPLDKLQNILGGSGGNVRFVIEGDQLVGVLDNYAKVQNSF